MIGIVIASHVEAAPFLALQKWDAIETEPFGIYKGNLGLGISEAFVVVSGIGKVAAAVATHLLICKYGIKRIFNFGICGALKQADGFVTGAMFTINMAVEGDRREGPEMAKPERCVTDFFCVLPTAKLVTCDQPVFNARRKEDLLELGDLVDMEGAAIARVANMYGVPCVLIKGISDGAKEGDRNELLKNIDMVSCKLASFCFNTIRKLNTLEAG